MGVGTQLALCDAMVVLQHGILTDLWNIVWKTWRVYRIFIIFTSEHRFISDCTIIMFVLGLLAFDMIINLSFSVANPCCLQMLEAHFNGSD